MLSAINSSFRERFPKLQSLLKKRIYDADLALPKRLWGNVLWTHARLWNHVIYDQSVLQWIVDTLKPGDVFFDVGAHQGWLSLAASKRVGHLGKVVSFEPSPPLVRYLEFHKRANRLSQMIVVPKAITDSDATEVPFHVIGDGDDVRNSLLSIDTFDQDPRGRTVIRVQTTTLDQYIEESGIIPRLVKIDVEGSELNVCQGARNLLQKHRPLLIVATHRDWLPEGQTIEQLFAVLTDCGYRIQASDSLPYSKGAFCDFLMVPE